MWNVITLLLKITVISFNYTAINYCVMDIVQLFYRLFLNNNNYLHIL